MFELSSIAVGRLPLLGAAQPFAAPLSGVSGESRAAAQRGALSAGEQSENGGKCSCGSPRGSCNCASEKGAAGSVSKVAGKGRAGTAEAGEARSVTGEPLTEEQKEEVQRLKKRDQEVRAHEEAHAAAAGPLAQGGPQYEYTTGPDGKQYAIGGHVEINTSPGRTPEETIDKAEQIQRAALAPAEPSGQDIQVAAKAAQMKAEAQKEALTQDKEDVTSGPEDDGENDLTKISTAGGERGSAEQKAEEIAATAAASSFQNPFSGGVARLAAAFLPSSTEPGNLFRQYA
jgi:hypothetical protein